jgi:mRNA interferase MazF
MLLALYDHIPLEPQSLLEQPTWVMSEQIRAISRSRITKVVGRAGESTLRQAMTWLSDFLVTPQA